MVRNENYLYTIPSLKRLTLALVYKKADVVISQTEEMEDELVSIGIKKIKYIQYITP